MSLRLGYCANGFTRVDVEGALRGIAAAGYSGAELLLDAPHLWPPESALDRLPQLQRLCEELELQICSINANTAAGAEEDIPWEAGFGPSLADPDPSRRAIRREQIEIAIELSEGLGRPPITLTLGPRPDDQTLQAEMRTQAEELLVPLARRAEAAGVRLGIEAEPGLLQENSLEVAALLNRHSNLTALGFNLDVGHCVVAGEDPAEVIRRHASRIWHLHLEDIRGGIHEHLPPGEGEMDFPAIVEALRDSGWEGWASLELYPWRDQADQTARRAFTALAPLFDSIRQ